MSSNLIKLNKVNKYFNKEKIIDNLNLAITKGDIISFIGGNGSGKSTILKMIAGLIYQDSGEIQVFGIDSRKKQNLYNCEFVLESGQGYYGYLTAYENARYFFGLNKMSFQMIKNEFKQLCADLDFTQHLDKKVDALSQGNRQKLSLIISLLSKAKILLLDEPTNGLDYESIKVLSKILLEKNKNEQLTILITTHDYSFIEMLKSEVFLVENGKVKKDIDLYQYTKQEIEYFNIKINNEDYDKFLQEYPNIEINRCKSYFEVKVNKEVKNKIITIYDVFEFSKGKIRDITLEEWT